MRKVPLYLYLSGLLLVTMISCEIEGEEESTVCLPTNMTATIVQGYDTKKVIADFHYREGSDLIDHITRSDHQTHYFEYDESDRLKVVRKVLVKEKLQEEMWFVYQEGMVHRVDLITRHLNYTYLEPIDSVYSGHIELEWSGGRIIAQKRFEVLEGSGAEDLAYQAKYEYDDSGNLLKVTSADARGPWELTTMTYDEGKHPFSGLSYYFEEESHVNNLLSRTTAEGFEYIYNIELNSYDYPDIIYEKLGATNTRIIRYTYRLK